jgi:hypothetical protein
MDGTGLKNDALISELLMSGSATLQPRNSSGVYMFDASNLQDGIVSGQLTKPKYNNTELIKSVDTVIVELLPVEAPPLDDTVPRPIYNEATQSVIDLTAEVARLNTIVSDLRAKVDEVQIISESLRVSLDLKDINVAASQNQTTQLTTKISSTITQLQNSIQKATAESIQRVSLYARNQSLQQELDALRIAASAKEQALAAGAVSTGQLASILFDAGDPTKSAVKGTMLSMDYGGGYGSKASAGKFAAPGNEFAAAFRSYFDVIASSGLTGTQKITVDIKFSGGGVTNSIFDFGVSLPATLDKGETKRFDMSKPSAYLNSLAGQHGGGLFSHSKPTEYNFTMSIIVTDSNGKTENKDFTIKLYNHN